jgi:hypothetical protein
MRVPVASREPHFEFRHARLIRRQSYGARMLTRAVNS